ncbi:MAG: DUF4363 family protein [Clostridiales bacterium]|nr:DUF4363 family protein [Clostridiales bacterium]
MKRLYIALLFMIIALCIAGTETGYVSARADAFISKIDNIDRLIKKNEYNEALALCKSAEDEWEECAKSIDMLLIHDYVDEIGISISQMRSYVEAQNSDMYFSESTMAKKHSPP